MSDDKTPRRIWEKTPLTRLGTAHRFTAIEEVLYLIQDIKPRPTQLTIRTLVHEYCTAWTHAEHERITPMSVRERIEYCRAQTLEAYRIMTQEDKRVR